MQKYNTRWLLIFSWSVALLFNGERAPAQSAQAILEGRITDQTTGDVIAGALVIAKSLQTNVSSYRYSNERGLYYFSALQPGMYAIRVDALGFQPQEKAPLELTVASRSALNFALESGQPLPAPVGQPAVGDTAGQPTILATMYGSDAAVPQAVLNDLPGPVTETEVTSLSSLIDQRKILDLPISGRDVYTLLVLQPGVTSDNATARGLGFSVNGQRASSSNFLLDGVDNNDLLITGPATPVSAEGVQEYRMTTINFTPEFGRSSGFVANAITRSGTNLLHGTLYEYFSHDRLNANTFAYNWQGVNRPPLRQNQFGASLGGPFRRDRLFFFANFEQTRISSETEPFEVLLPSQQLVSLLGRDAPAKQLLAQFPIPDGEAVAPGQAFAPRTAVRPTAQRNAFALWRSDYAWANEPREVYRNRPE